MKGLTVLMPAYNSSKHISFAIRSILNQTFTNFEFLIIDDGSNDNTGEIVRSFNDSRIVYKKIQHNGLAHALNFGLANASFDWIARIDADDLNTTNRLERQIDFLKKHKSCDVVSSWSVYFGANNKVLFLVKPPVHHNKIKEFLKLHNPINHSSVIFNKKKISNAGGYNESFKCYEDFELWLRVKDKVKFGIIPEFLVYTRLHETSLTYSESKDDIYKLLVKNANESSGNEIIKKNYLFWIEYFYGKKENARYYYDKNFSFRRAAAFLNTYLPEKSFDKILKLRLRYRLKSKFESKKFFEKELKKLLIDP